MTESDADIQAGALVDEEEGIDPIMLQMALEKLRSEQNLVGGLVSGAAAAVVGATLWAVVTVLTGYQIGWIAIGVGFLVAVAVRVVGKGIDRSFAIAGAALALFGCLLGNLFTVTHFLATAEGVGFFEVLSQLNLTAVVELMKVTFSPMDLLFYGIAVYEGFKLSRRQISPEELVAAVKGSAAGHGS